MADTVYFADLTPIGTINGADIMAVQTDPVSHTKGFKMTIDEMTLYTHTNVDYINFNTAFATAINEGDIAWDGEAGTLRIGMPGGNVVLQVGQEIHLPNRPRNVETVQINDGQIVYISGATGAVPEVKLASAADFENGCNTIAVATENIAASQRGFYTSFGIVRDIDTSSWAEGEELWLGTTLGSFINIRPEAPNCPVRMGYVVRQHATEGAIFVTIDIERDLAVRDITRAPTGFTNPDDVIVTANPGARTITLTGTVNAYYKGVPIPEITTGYTSPAHNNDTESYFLVYDGTTIQWIDLVNLEFYYTFICFTFYDSSNAQRVYIRETHGVAPWQNHKQDHEARGTYLVSGGSFSDYVPGSNTPTDRRPSISTTTLADEDLETILSSLVSGGPYTQLYLSGGAGDENNGDTNFILSQTEILQLSGAQPYWNEFDGTNWVQTLVNNNNYTSLWAIAIPVTSDTQSQEYRFCIMEGQDTSATLLAQKSLDPEGVNLGKLKLLTPESFIFGQIVIGYLGGDWDIEEIIPIRGSRTSQIKGGGSGGLSVVEHDSTLTGDGTVSSPLGVVESEVVPTAHKDEYTATNNQTAFTLTEEPVAKASIDFIRNGVVELSDNYSYTGTALTWSGVSLDAGEEIIIAYNSLSGGSGELWKIDSGAITQKTTDTPVRLDIDTDADDTLLELNRTTGAINGQINIYHKLITDAAQTAGAKICNYYEIAPNAGDTSNASYAMNWYKDATATGSSDKVCNITESNWDYFFSGESGNFRFIDYNVVFQGVTAVTGAGNSISILGAPGLGTDQNGGDVIIRGGAKTGTGINGDVVSPTGYFFNYQSHPVYTEQTQMIDKEFSENDTLTETSQAETNVALSNVTGNGTTYTVLFQITPREVGSSYASGTGKFTTTKNGFFGVSTTIELTGITGSMTDLEANFVADGKTIPFYRVNPSTIHVSGTIAFSGSLAAFPIDSGNTVEVRITVSGDTQTVSVSQFSTFCVNYLGDYSPNI
jgi:hypothetical protein